MKLKLLDEINPDGPLAPDALPPTPWDKKELVAGYFELVIEEWAMRFWAPCVCVPLRKRRRKSRAISEYEGAREY